MRTLVTGIGARAERLPDLLETFDQMTDIITADGLRLHPDTIAAFRQREASCRYWRYGVTFLAILLVVSLLAHL